MVWIVKTVSLCRASTRRKSFEKFQKFWTDNVTRTFSYGVGAILLNFLKLSVQFTANSDPAQRNGFHYLLLVFFMLSMIHIITHTSEEVHTDTYNPVEILAVLSSSETFI